MLKTVPTDCPNKINAQIKDQMHIKPLKITVIIVAITVHLELISAVCLFKKMAVHRAITTIFQTQLYNNYKQWLLLIIYLFFEPVILVSRDQ